jgi:periplasmic protein TonB
MRAWTLGVSIVVHLCVIASVIVAPLFATGALPVPPGTHEAYIPAVAIVPDPPPAPRPVATAPSTTAAPLTAPDSVIPEPPAPASLPGPTDFDAVGGDAHAAAFLPSVSGSELLPPPPPAPPAPVAPIRVGGAIRAPQKIRDVAPRYPAIAQASKVQGVVILEAVIGEDGTVRDVRVLRGQPLLDDAAADAVRQWRFTPTLLNGQPIPVVMTVTVSFRLN